MRILVTGATGYVGQHVCSSLRLRGHDVAGLTRVVTSRRARELTAHEVTLVEGSLKEPDTFRAQLRWADAVIHCALDEDDPLAGDRKLFAALVAEDALDGRRRHLVYTSGCSVYGSGSHHRVLTESTPVDPSSWRAQVEAELAATGLLHTVVRPGFVYGGNGRRSVTGQWFAAAEEGRPVFYGDTSKRWSWIHVHDLANAFTRSIDRPPASGAEIYCLADQSPVQALATMEACVRAAGFTGKIETLPAELGPDSLAVFDHHEVVDSAKARSGLGWEALQPALLTRVEHLFRAWSADRSAC